LLKIEWNYFSKEVCALAKAKAHLDFALFLLTLALFFTIPSLSFLL
jgi:hypothetical protein